MSQFVPAEQLWTEFHGKLEFEYDHSVYWPALMKMCDDRREARLQRWVAGGKQIGELEDYITGLLDTGAAGPRSPTPSQEKVDAVEVPAPSSSSAAAEKTDEATTENSPAPAPAAAAPVAQA